MAVGSFLGGCSSRDDVTGDPPSGTVENAGEGVSAASSPDTREEEAIVFLGKYYQTNGPCIQFDDAIAMPIIDAFEVVEVLEGNPNVKHVSVRAMTEGGSSYPKDMAEGEIYTLRLTPSAETSERLREAGSEEGFANLWVDGDEIEEQKAPVRQADIDALVSSNPPTTGEWLEQLPAAWSPDENGRVWAGYEALVSRGKDAVPVLIANLDRKEYSSSISTAVPYAPLSVGAICRMAVSEMFDPIGVMYKSRTNAKGETLMGYSYFDVAFATRPQAEKWWKENQRKSLEQIREMIRDWHIEREITFGFHDDEERKSILDQIDQRFSRDENHLLRVHGVLGPRSRMDGLPIPEKGAD